MDYDSWLARVPSAVTSDRLWSVTTYRLALFAADAAWDDARRAATDRVTSAIAGQLYRAVGSISANVAEGYSRSTGRDRARFFEYALGSARESCVWYLLCRPRLGPELAERLATLSEIRRLLIAMITAERGRARIGPRSTASTHR